MEDEELVAYYHDIYVYAYSLSKSPHEAEDIAQETMLKAISNISSFDGRKNIRAWLFTIARNIFYNKKRKDKHIILEDFGASPIQDSRIHFQETLVQHEQTKQIHQYLHNMKEPYKEVFTLRVFGELSFKSIGELFGTSENRVYG